MKVLIVEPEVKGHFISLYVLNILKSLNKNHKVFLLTSKKILNTDVLKLINKDYPSLKILFTDNLKYPKSKNPISLFYFQHINFEKVRKKIMYYDGLHNFDNIFFTNLDHYDKVICFYTNPFKSKSFSGILVNPRVHQFHKKNYLKYIIYQYLIKKLLGNKFLKKILSNDILFFKFFKKKKYSNKIYYFNEPVSLINFKKKKSNNQPKKNELKILIYGSIRYSKSIEELIVLVKNLNNQINIKVTIAGVHEADIKKILTKKNLEYYNVIHNFNIINKFINPKFEADLFMKTDLVWCVYKNTPLGSSGVFHIANNYKKPIVTNNEGLVAWYNKKYKLGPIINFKNKKNIKNASKLILNLYNNEELYRFYCANQLKLYKNLKKHKKFSQIVKNLMTE